VLPLPCGRTRAFYRLVSRAYDKKPGERNKLGGFQANQDGKDDAAARIIRHNSILSVRELVELLAEAGIKRGKTWVSETRMKQRARADD
jgi:hypothetical protein